MFGLPFSTHKKSDHTVAFF